MNKRYKISKYLLFTKSGNGKLIVYNVYRNTYVILEKEKEAEAMLVIDNPNKYCHTDIFNQLYDKKIILEDNYAESDIIEWEYLKMAYRSDSLSLTIVPTHDCNLACQYCYQKHVEEYMSKQTYSSLLKCIDKCASKYRSIEINWFGGEPLLVVDKIIEISEKIKEIARLHKCAIIQRMTTNGVLLKYETFERLIKNGILYYQITIDGPKKIHDKLRPLEGESSFELIMQNMREISQQSSSRLFHISLRMNLTRKGIEGIYDLMDEYTQSIGSDKRFGIDLNMADNWGGDSAKEVDFLAEDEYNAQILRILKYIDSKGLNVQDKLMNVGSMVCDAQKNNGFIIDYDGTIHKCTIAMFIDEYKELSRVGFISEDGAMHVAPSKLMLWLNNRTDRSKCRDCSIYPICMGRPCVYAVNVKNINQCSLKSRNNPISRMQFALMRKEI